VNRSKCEAVERLDELACIGALLLAAASLATQR